jgi:hypothetical protein
MTSPWQPCPAQRRLAPITWRPNANARGNPVPVQNYGNQAGGGIVHYGTVSWRFHEDDFRARSQTIERYGASVVQATLSGLLSSVMSTSRFDLQNL